MKLKIPKLKFPNIKKIVKQYIRVLKIMKKPDKDEYFLVAKITGLGIIIIGVIGFIIFLIYNLIIRLGV